MALHHEVIVASASGLSISILAWGAFALNAAAYYVRCFLKRIKPMPCYSRQTSTIQFGAQTDRPMLMRALDALGYASWVQSDGTLAFQGNDVSRATLAQDGTLTVTGAEGAFDVNALKRAYSTEVVKAAAQRFGWQTKQTKENTFQVQRRF